MNLGKTGDQDQEFPKEDFVRDERRLVESSGWEQTWRTYRNVARAWKQNCLKSGLFENKLILVEQEQTKLLK